MDDAPRIKRLLEQAVEEIEDLRQVNEVLRAKVEMIDLFACVLHSRPPERSETMAEDVAWKLRREIVGIERAQQMARDGVTDDE